MGNLLFRSLLENAASSRSCAVLLLENASSAHGQGGRRYDPSHALSVIERGPGVLLKSRYLRRSLYVYWAQTGVDACFHGVGCRGLWDELQRVLHRSRSAVDCDPASEPADRNWFNDDSDFTSLGNIRYQTEIADHERGLLDE